MILEKDLGSYGRSIVRFFGSFLVDGTSDPDGVRTGKSAAFTVARTDVGLFTITFASGFPIPELIIAGWAHKSIAATMTAKSQTAHLVVGSYSQTDRTFQIVVITNGDVAGSAYADPAVGEPNDNDRISFELIGSISSAGTDAA